MAHQPETSTTPLALTPSPEGYLTRLGAYGFSEQEPLILAALVTGDPLLLIGRSGTGKTFLLNSISEVLGLEHRHYNASLISFDDLVGFPYPNDEKTGVQFLQTPATVWGAESVLIDEISRCKPEHQNRLFSLVHERKLQGLQLESLRYRWAAMNPCTADHLNGFDSYSGSEPLDAALADRFAIIVEVGDWDALSSGDRRRVADPSGEGAIADDGGLLAAHLQGWQAGFAEALRSTPAHVIDYVTLAVTALRSAGVRISPRRARLIARTLVAARLVAGHSAARDLNAARRLFLSVLRGSLPHRAWGESISDDAVLAAHELAWTSCGIAASAQWLSRFHIEPTLKGKARLLLEAPDRDTGTIAVAQLIANGGAAEVAAFCFAAFAAAAMQLLPLNAEGVHDLGRVAQPILTVDGSVSWKESLGQSNTQHPALAAYAEVIAKLCGARAARARQLLYHCAVQQIDVADPVAYERAFHDCVSVFAALEGN
jgi:MoxR-like ATPase